MLVSPLPAVNSFPEHEATVQARIESVGQSWARSFIVVTEFTTPAAVKRIVTRILDPARLNR